VKKHIYDLPCGVKGVCADDCPDPAKRNTNLKDPDNAIERCYRVMKRMKEAKK
jgi:hypothetical protein